MMINMEALLDQSGCVVILALGLREPYFPSNLGEFPQKEAEFLTDVGQF